MVGCDSFVFFFKQTSAYEIMPRLVGSELCIRDRVHDDGGAEACLSTPHAAGISTLIALQPPLGA